MTNSSLTHVATFSMLLAFVISQKWQKKGKPMSAFYDLTGISQPSWSRLSRGQTRFDVEDLKAIEQKTGFTMETLIGDAKTLQRGVTKEGIEIVEPYTTQRKSDLADLGKAVVAVAVLAFIASQVVKK